jgi:hypothetical protein
VCRRPGGRTAVCSSVMSTALACAVVAGNSPPVPTPRGPAARLATGNDLDIVIVTDEEVIRKFPGRRITPSERA